MAKTKQPRDSEFHAYGFIRDELKERGWDVRNPKNHPTGQVYTQGECLADTELKACLGLDRPENVVKVTDSVVWVIEAKREHSQLGQALREAEDYARKINQSKNIKALFISGVAGNPTDSFIVETHFLVGNKFKPITINCKDVTSLIRPEEAKTVLSSGSPVIKDLEIDEALVLAKAESINKILHLGAINKSLRARVMAALMLSLIDTPAPNVDAAPSVLISEINAKAKRILSLHRKPEFFSYIEIELPTTEDNHIKFKTALVQTIQELNNLNIRSAMNSGTDVLGKFYEVFLKYGNGAKEIGIVLTPRHITEFAVNVVSVTDKDVVFDPTCGTAGFLVAAFDEIKRNYSEKIVNSFKENNIFGVEQDPDVVALAIVNMIFRGDGKNNIAEGNCFAKHLARESDGKIKYQDKPAKEDDLAITKVLMNPPFALKDSADKEYRFINHALKQMQDGGILFCVLPYSVMVKSGGYFNWRKDTLLRNNTLLSVITFPPDLFYPVCVHSVGIFVKKGVPHPKEQNVYWIRAINDGLLKSKGKRLPHPKTENDYPKIRNLLKAFIANPTLEISNKERFQKACPIDFEDSMLELVPENYLDQEVPSETQIRSGIEQIVRDTAAFLIQERKENELEFNRKEAGRIIPSQVGQLPFDK
ncbi:MAG: SAM-dependent methyltransferase [Acidobacteriota bacterium]|nr:SAM-dependent methyltransferase [Acidobacteriota bacterium]